MESDERKLIKNLLEITEESQTLEFKRLSSEKSQVRKICETVVSFANAEGGVIVLGIADPEQAHMKGLDRVTGIEEGLDNFDALGREVQSIMPPLGGIWPPEIIEISEISKRIALLYIPKAVDHFRSIHNEVFVRQEKSNRRLTPQEIVQLSYVKGFAKADRELVDVDMRLLQTPVYDEWRSSRAVSGATMTEILEKVGLARMGDNGQIQPTRAAVLLFAEHPTDIMETKCAIRVFQYTGKIETMREVPNMVGIPRTISGPIVNQIRDAHDYVLTLLRTGIKIPSGFMTTYQIPERPIKEAITNAVIHRDYFTKRDIEIRIFEDRVEVESPGLFPYNITAANIGFVRSGGFRNDLLVKHLREFPSPPNLDQNEGVRAMRNEMKAKNLYPPIFWTYPHLQDAVRVVLLNERETNEWEKVSHYLKSNKYITNREARSVTGVVQITKMSKMLNNWVKQGLLKKIETASRGPKGTKYRLQNTEDLSKQV